MNDYASSAALLGAIVGVLYALAFQLIPGLTPWFESKPKETKAQFMLLLLVVSAVGVVLTSCYTTFLSGIVSCSQPGFQQVVGGFVAALMGGILTNQSTHSLAKTALPTYGRLDVDVPPYNEIDPTLFK